MVLKGLICICSHERGRKFSLFERFINSTLRWENSLSPDLLKLGILNMLKNFCHLGSFFMQYTNFKLIVLKWNYLDQNGPTATHQPEYT